MCRAILVALLAAAAVAAQASKPEGTWNSDEKYNGETRVVVVLKNDGGQFGGTITMRGITDDDNNVTTLNLAIRSAKMEGEKLSFEAKMPDDNVTEWEMTFNGSTATASIVADQDGPYSVPQSWKLSRAER
jgi:hypothetical protein